MGKEVISLGFGYDETNIGFIYLFNQWLFKYIYLNITLTDVLKTIKINITAIQESRWPGADLLTSREYSF